MPPTRRTRVGKNQREREYFTREIRKVDYQPTLDESLDFHSSDDNQSDLSISKVAASRPPKIKERLADHFKENWIIWVIGGISVLLFFFVFSFNRDIGKIEGKIDGIDTSMKEMKRGVDDIKDKVHNQDIKINETQVRLEYATKGGKK